VPNTMTLNQPGKRAQEDILMAELWAAYRAQPNDEMRRQLIEQYALLAKYVVDRLHLQPMHGISYDDLIGQAIVGLIEAIDRYDPSRGVKFNTFAYYRIRGAVMDMLRDMDWVPRSLRSKSNDIIGTITKLESELGRAPEDKEIAKAMGISIDEFDQIVNDVGGQVLMSLDEYVDSGDGDSSVSVGDSLADDPAMNPHEIIAEDDQRVQLARSIEALPENEKMVVALYYQDGLTLKEIGKVLGVTESRVCQIHSKAIIRLRAMMEKANTI
jgi:RNA polymerase sigma factor for flagellar operon FliA